MTDPVNDPAATGSSSSASTLAARAGVEDVRGGGPAIGLGAVPPHPKPVSLVGSYVYSYDLASAGRPSSPAGRSIPGMRPSYDAEHPVSATPIYDSLYSEYRRMFRALPGDRSGEEVLRFTGFAVRDQQPREAAAERHEPAPYPQQQLLAARDQQPREAVAERREPAPYPQQQQPSFETYAGQAQGAPPFMPSQGSGAQANGQGWVATGYLGPSPQPPAAPAPAAGPTAPGPAGGRHRSVLSLPPGRDA
ncbi:hypothetical protein [Kitasatospora sp. NPDC059673]|uniref:hypothetical protein n=1 Tax=Kitasatospora sp. NPDC059673 TaxID=3346901 RepID=UPI00369B5488